MAFEVTITGTSIRRILVRVAVFAAIVLLAWVLWRLFSSSDSVEERIDRGGYQAVSLTTGQLYIGRLRDTGGDFVEVRDAHYIREVRSGEKDAPTSSEVVPTSTQLHAPRSRIVFARSQIVTIEDLAEDSPAVKAITDGEN